LGKLKRSPRSLSPRSLVDFRGPLRGRGKGKDGKEGGEKGEKGYWEGREGKRGGREREERESLHHWR